jgi:hypothetical protein
MYSRLSGRACKKRKGDRSDSPQGKLNGGGMGMESKTLRVGFLPLNDCAPIVIARELGLFEQSHRQRQRDAELQSAGLCCRHSQSTSAEPAVYEVLSHSCGQLWRAVILSFILILIFSL